MAKKYEVVRPWFGVAKGQIIESDNLSPNFKANVREVGAELAAATTDTGEVKKLNAALKKSEAAAAEKDKRIAELEAQLAEAAKPQEPQK